MSRTHTRAIALVVALVSMLSVGLASTSTASAKPRPAALTTPVTGSIADGGSFAGTLSVTKFVSQDGRLVAVGTLSGTATDSTGTLLGTVTDKAVQLPVDLAASAGTCQILDLVLGPLDLDLLGLVVHLDRVHLNITAQQGPGNLLGNLLCAVAGLLDDAGSPLGGLAGLLNQILGLLG